MYVNRKYKDRLFRLVFQEKQDLLELYNAINGSHYENPEELKIVTLDDVIYLHMKNDVAFLLGDILNLWEHQSTYNPNMPVRGLSYFAESYQSYMEEHKINIYSSSQKMLPFPRYIVFYNGTKQQPERMKLRLSDAFFKKNGEAMEPAVEVVAEMINVNWGNNQALMEQCQKLREYSLFVDCVRRYSETMTLGMAVRKAVDECIAKGILKKILLKNKAEVVSMFLKEYDEEKHMEMEREDGVREGEVRMLYSLVQDGLLTLQTGASRLGVPEEQFLADMKASGYTLQ